MKKLITLLLLLMPLFAFGQEIPKYVLTPDGLVDSEDVSKSYLVLPFEEKTSSELYSAAKMFVHEFSTHPKFSIIGDVEGKYIRFGVHISEIISFKKMMVKLAPDGIFQIEMKIKDGRVRFEILDLRMPFPDSSNELAIVGAKIKGWSIFNGKEKLLMKNEKVKLEDYFNGLVTQLVTYIDKESSSDDDW